MAISWVDYNNGANLGDIRTAINTFNNSVVTDVNTNTTAITGLTSSVSTNTSNINGNTTAIATNTANIATNTTDIAALQAITTYDYNTATNVTVTNDVYENVLTLTTPTRDAGTYELRMSQLYSLNSTTTSAFFRFRVNGGTYIEVRREPKDTTDLIPMSYFRILSHAGGTAITIEIEARKEVAGDVLTIAEVTAAIQRKS